jgi:hypothetical protein
MASGIQLIQVDPVALGESSTWQNGGNMTSGHPLSLITGEKTCIEHSSMHGKRSLMIVLNVFSTAGGQTYNLSASNLTLEFDHAVQQQQQQQQPPSLPPSQLVTIIQEDGTQQTINVIQVS